MIRKVSAILLLLSITNFGPTDGYKILGICPFNSRSHFALLEKLMKGLATKGHEVDVISHYPQKKTYPNYKDLSLSGSLPDLANALSLEDIEYLNSTFWVRDIIDVHGDTICGLLGHQVFQDLINKPSSYDVVIIHMFLSPCYFAFGRHLNIPMIAYSASALHDWMHEPFGNPANPSFVPSFGLNYAGKMNFKQRLFNTVTQCIANTIFKYKSASQNKYVKKYFGPDFPDVYELHKNVSLVLVNSHYSLNGVKPHTNAVIEIGGLHVQDNGEKLPAGTQKWLDESKEGCIYITFGSMTKIESLPKETLMAFYSSFENIAPVRVLMKITNEEELPAGLPKNVKTFSWLPQLQVLKHKNVKIFVTHGGLLSTTEALVFGVPMIGIPLFTDQFVNMNNYVRHQVAISLDRHSINKEILINAFEVILKNSVYRNNAQKLSKLYLDRPLTAMETAIFWTEYVARNGNILKSPALDLEWWQVELLDVYSFICFVVFVFFFIVYFVISKLFQYYLCILKDGKNLLSKKEK